MINKSPPTWVRTLLFVGGLIVVGPLCYLLWFGAVALVDGKPSTDAWLQSAANIVGAALSGGVAAFVAIMILNREQNSRDLEKLRDASKNLDAIRRWIREVSVAVVAITEQAHEGFVEKTPKLKAALISTRVVEKTTMQPEMKSEIASTHNALLVQIAVIEISLRRLAECCDSAAAVIPTNFGHDKSVTFDPEYLAHIGFWTAALGSDIANLVKDYSEIEYACREAISNLWAAGDRLMDATRAGGVKLDVQHVYRRPAWYKFT